MHKFLDSTIRAHVATRARGDHATIMTTQIAGVRQITDVPMYKFCVKCPSREVFSSLAREFLSRKKLMMHHSGKFAPSYSTVALYTV